MMFYDEDPSMEYFTKKTYYRVDPVNYRISNLKIKRNFLKKNSSRPLMLGTFIADVMQSGLFDSFASRQRFERQILLFFSQCEIKLLKGFYEMFKDNNEFEVLSSSFSTTKISGNSVWENFIISNQKGLEIIHFKSRVVIVDAEHRKPIRKFFDSEFGEEKIYQKQITDIPGKIIQLKNLGKPNSTLQHTITVKDIDDNNHTNFSVYLDLAERCLLISSSDLKIIKRTNISYKSECLLGDTIVGRCWKLDNKNYYFETLCQEELLTFGYFEFYSNENSINQAKL